MHAGAGIVQLCKGCYVLKSFVFCGLMRGVILANRVSTYCQGVDSDLQMLN